MDPRRLNRAPSDPMVRQVGFVTPGTHPTSPSRSQSVPVDTTSSSSPPAGDLSASASLSPVMIPPQRHNLVPVPVSLSPLRRNGSRNIQIQIGSYNPGTSPRLMSPPSGSRFDVESEISDDVSILTVAWEGGGGGAGKAASSFPGMSSGEMMAMNAGGGNTVAATPVAKSMLTTASVVKTVPGVTGTCQLIKN